MIVRVIGSLKNYSGFTYSLNNNTNSTMMNNAITQTMKNRATATRFDLTQGTRQAIKTKR